MTTRPFLTDFFEIGKGPAFLCNLSWQKFEITVFGILYFTKGFDRAILLNSKLWECVVVSFFEDFSKNFKKLYTFFLFVRIKRQKSGKEGMKYDLAPIIYTVMYTIIVIMSSKSKQNKKQRSKQQ